HPLRNLAVYYEQSFRLGPTNSIIDQAVDQVRMNRLADEIVVLDSELQTFDIRESAVDVLDALHLALALERVPFRLDRLDPPTVLLNPRLRCRDLLVILARREADQNDQIVAALDLRALDHSRRPSPPTAPAMWGLYRLDRLSDVTAGAGAAADEPLGGLSRADVTGLWRGDSSGLWRS